MAKQKACKECKTIFDSGNKCPKCGSTNITESIKGKIKVFKPEESELAKKLKINEKGEYALKS